jgi:ADP-ribose pyrophosphatase YjhB (NUDIX family)
LRTSKPSTTPRFSHGAASVITDEEGRVLLVRHGYGEQNWEIPGGAGEPGESAEETARREALEEIGVGIEIERMSGVYFDPTNGAHHFAFRARCTGAPRSADPSEISDVGWFLPADLPRPVSDWTELRIRDALSDGPAVFHTIGPRVWRR